MTFPGRSLNTLLILLMASVPAFAAKKKNPTQLADMDTASICASVSSKDSLLLDSMTNRSREQDTLLALRNRALAIAQGDLERIRTDSTDLATVLASNSALLALLRDSTARLSKFDSNMVRIDSVHVSDSLLLDKIGPIRELTAIAAIRSGHGVRFSERVPGFRDGVPVRVRLKQFDDSTWFSIDQDGLVVGDSIPSTSTAKVERLERDVLRKAFGPNAFPPEPSTGLAWNWRLAILGSATLAAVITMVSLW